MAAYDIGPKIGIEGEKEFKNSIKAIESQIKALSGELKNLSREYDENDRSIEGVTKKQQVLAGAVDASARKIQLLTAQWEKQRAKLKQLEAALDDARRTNGEGSDQALKAEAAWARQATAVNNLEARLQAAKGQLAGFSQELENTGNRATVAGDKLQAAGDKLQTVGGRLSSAGNVLTGAVTAPLLGLGGAAVSLASDYEESLNKVDVAFGASAGQIQDFAKTTVESYGIAEGSALDMAALFGDMATSMQVPQEEAARMSQKLVGLAGDLASFKNMELSQVETALKGIFTGETESLKELGVVMTQANLDAFALAEGFGKTTAEMTEAEKVQLRYQYVLAATQNAQGDYARTADGTANSLRTLRESAKELGVAFGQELLPVVTPVIQGAADMIRSFGELDQEAKQTAISAAGVAAAIGPVSKVAGTAVSGIGKLTKGVGTIVSDLGKLSQSGWKATDAMSGFGKLVGTLASPGGAIALGAVAVAGIGAAALAARDQLVQADMEGRFGDMVLSMEEVEEVAERLTTTDWTLRVDAYVDAQAELDKAFSTLEEAQKELEKQAWKVSVKMELTEEDVGAFQSAVDGYVQSAIAAVEESSYTAQVAVSAVFLPGSEAGAAVQAYSSAFYAKTQGELTALGDDLSMLVDKALADGILSHQELMDIGAIQSRMQDLLDKIADRNYQVELKQLELTAGGAALSVESFRGILDEGGQILETRLENLRSVTANVEVQLEAMLAQGEIDQATFARWKQEMEASLAGQTAEATLPLVQLGVEQIETNYSDVIGRAKEEFQERLNEAFSTMEADPGQVDWFNKLWSEFEWNFQISDDKARAGVSQLMQAMQPEKEALEALRQQYVEAGRIPPESLTEGLANIYSLEQMSGAADNTFALMAHAIAESPQRQEAVAQALLAGQELDASLAQALRDNYGLIWDANQGTWKQLKESNALAAAEVAGFLNQYGAMFGDTFCQSMASKYGLVYENGQYLVKNVAQGVHDESPTLLMEGEQLAANTVGVMDSTISGSTVGPPSVAAPDGYTAGYNYMAELQYYLDTHPATVSVGMSGPAAMKMLGYESGGIVEEPQIAAIAENGAEAIIPLENHRARALDLWYQAGHELNAFAADSARDAGAARRERVVQQSTDNRRQYTIEEGAITIHTQATDGKRLYKELVREMQKDVKRKEAAYGKN